MRRCERRGGGQPTGSVADAGPSLRRGDGEEFIVLSFRGGVAAVGVGADARKASGGNNATDKTLSEIIVITTILLLFTPTTAPFLTSATV